MKWGQIPGSCQRVEKKAVEHEDGGDTLGTVRNNLTKRLSKADSIQPNENTYKSPGDNFLTETSV